MAKTEFYKVHGATERQDQVVRLSENNYLLIFGFDKDNKTDESGWQWRKNYDHKPTIEELKEDIHSLLNQEVDNAILSKFVWNGKKVWLSSENQMNFKAAYDLAFQTLGKTLPVKFKLGEDSGGNPVYYTFERLDEFSDFYTTVVEYINATLNEGWKEKDGINWELFK